MAFVKIKKSVGKNGKNDVDDTKRIQELLNAHKSQGGYSALAVDGDVGKKTVAAIMAFQSKVMGVKADGRVDVDGPTLAALNSRPGSVTPAPDPSPASGPAKKKPSSGGGSGGSEIEKRIAAAQAAIEDTTSSIRQQETVSTNLRARELLLEQLQKIAPERINVAKSALAAADEQRKAKALEELEAAAVKAGKCLIETETDAKAIEGAKCEAGLGAQIVACARLFLDDNVSKISAKLDETKARLDRYVTIGIGVLQTIRIANEAYILILKGKRALHEKALELARQELKKA